MVFPKGSHQPCRLSRIPAHPSHRLQPSKCSSHGSNGPAQHLMFPLSECLPLWGVVPFHCSPKPVCYPKGPAPPSRPKGRYKPCQIQAKANPSGIGNCCHACPILHHWRISVCRSVSGRLANKHSQRARPLLPTFGQAKVRCRSPLTHNGPSALWPLQINQTRSLPWLKTKAHRPA